MIAKTEFKITDPSDFSPEEAEAIARKQGDVEYAEKLCQTYGIEPPWTLDQLLKSEINDHYIIDKCLVKGQPCVIAGASKTMKTTLAVNMALALASGESFLGRFSCDGPKKVFFASAESGIGTLKKAIIAMADQMFDEDERALQELCNQDMMRIQWWVPKTNSLELLDFFLKLVDSHESDIVFLDPLYQMIDDHQASMILNGQQLGILANHIIKRGATPIFLDHAKRSSINTKEHKPLELDDISGAGKSEYFRQWLLLSRRSTFVAGELHRLWLSVGGSAGHASQWSVDIAEHNESETERRYEIELRSRYEEELNVMEQRQNKSEQRQAERESAKEERIRQKAEALLSILKAEMSVLTKTDVADRLNISNADAGKVIGLLQNEGKVRSVPNGVTKNSKKFDGYALSDMLAFNQTEGALQ